VVNPVLGNSKAEATDHFELRARACGKNHNDASGKITGVVYVDEAGRMHETKSARRGVAATSLKRPELLLIRRPTNSHGLGNSSGHLGRNYMRHVFSVIFGKMPGPYMLTAEHNCRPDLGRAIS